MTVTHKPRGQVADKAFFRGHDEFLPCVPLGEWHMINPCVADTIGHAFPADMAPAKKWHHFPADKRGQFADMDTCNYSLRTYTVRNETKNKKTRIGATIGKCSCVFHCTKVLTKLTFSAARTQDPAKTFGSQVSVSWLVSLPTPCRLEPKKATKNILTHRNGHCGKNMKKPIKMTLNSNSSKKTFDNKKS